MQSKTLYYLYSLDIQNKNLLYSPAKMDILIRGTSLSLAKTGRGKKLVHTGGLTD